MFPSIARRLKRATGRYGFTLPLTLVILVFASGCAVLFPDTDADPDPPTRGKLSDAADQASVDPEKQKAAKDRAGKTTTESKKRKQEEEEEDDDDQWVYTPSFDDEDDDVSAVSALLGPGAASPSSSDVSARFLGGPVGGVGFEAGGVFERVDITGIKVGGLLESDDTSPDLGAVSVSGLITKPRLRSTHPLHSSIEDDIVEVAAEFAIRGYATPAHTFLGAYLLLGYRVGWMHWDWRSPVLAPNDSGGTDEIREDSLVTHVIFAGLGVSPVQLKHVHVGVNFAYGLKFYSGTTGERFENDLFRDVGAGRFLVEAVFVL